MKKTLLGAGIAALAFTFLLAGPEPAFATMEMQKEAKAAGIDVKNCKHCHTVAMPKKGTPALNEAGQWLVDEGAKRKATKLDMAWLKEYKPKQ